MLRLPAVGDNAAMIHLVLLLNDVVFLIGCFVCGLSLGALLIGALFGTLVRFSGIPRTRKSTRH